MRIVHLFLFALATSCSGGEGMTSSVHQGGSSASFDAGCEPGRAIECECVESFVASGGYDAGGSTESPRGEQHSGPLAIATIDQPPTGGADAAGGAGTGGVSAGTGGVSAGTGGVSAGTGGVSAGTGGVSAGSGGDAPGCNGECDEGSICNAGTEWECVECADDGDCKNAVCDSVTNTCVECEYDSDCKYSDRPMCLDDNRCWGCQSDSDCDNDTVNPLANNACSEATRDCRICHHGDTRTCSGTCVGVQVCGYDNRTIWSPCLTKEGEECANVGPNGCSDVGGVRCQDDSCAILSCD